MKTSQRGVDLIKRFEGVRYKAYRDAVGIWTIGYGHTSAAGLPKVKSGLEVAPRQAEAILRRDLGVFEKGVREAVSVALSQSQFDALVSFAFNVGVGALKRSTLLKKLNKSDYHGAAKEFVKWTRAGNRRLKGLFRRRKAERDLFLQGTVRKNLAKSRTMWGALATGAGQGVSQFSGEVTDLATTLTGLSAHHQWFEYAGAALSILGVLLVIYARVQDNRNGLR